VLLTRRRIVPCARESDDVVRFVGVYASADVVTTYVTEVQPHGEQRRRPLE